MMANVFSRFPCYHRGHPVLRLDPEERMLKYRLPSKGSWLPEGFCQEDGGVYNEWDDPVVDTAALVITLRAG